MAVNAESKQSPAAAAAGNGEKMEESMFSPGFRSVAQLAGWDEEALLVASLVVEDTPDRQPKNKRRTNLQLKTPPTNSRRKRKIQRRSSAAIPVTVLDLADEDESPKQENEKGEKESEKNGNDDDKKMGDAKSQELEYGGSAIPCMDKLREELSCAICLEICYEPSTTPCGHSFCKKCLRSAADKCGKRCPKCRRLISNGRSCTVNTVLWNTIQLLFPQEVEARKAAGAVDNRESECQILETRSRNQTFQMLTGLERERQSSERRRSSHDLRNRSVRPSGISRRGGDVRSGVTVRRRC